MSSIGQQYTFWNLINDYKIIVPKIQRDYVQGRENKTVEKNREEFVKELTDSLAGNKLMSLNFVYGTIHGDEFIPIDGQQRLTTLFLLHLYVFAKKEDTVAIEKLQNKFSYQTRYTTNRFLEKLSGELPQMLKLSCRNADLAEIIRDSGGYVAPWDSDPNIRSCLVMLQTIHDTYNGMLANCNDDVSKFFNRLTGADCPITFMWLQLPSSFGSDNQLYIRMNSRGKQLTDFENFKAELYEKILKSNGDKEKEQINDFKKNLDGDWYSLFWDAGLCRDTSKSQAQIKKHNMNFDEENIEKRASLIDRLLQHIFHWTIVSLICKDTVDLTSSSKNSTKEFEKSLYSDLQPSCEIERVYIQEYIDLYQNWKDYEDEDNLEGEERESREKEREVAFSENITEDFAGTLSFLSGLKRKEDGKKIFRFIINDIFQINYGRKDSINFTIEQYSARVLLYAITKFVKDYKLEKKNNEIEDFKAWYRVVLNLVSTQEIDSPEDFQSAVKVLGECNFTENPQINDSIQCWLKKLCEEWKDNPQIKRAFRLAQVEEEKQKLNLIKSGEEWKNAILQAENTCFEQDYQERDYFSGQIGFLLLMSKENGDYNVNKFNQIYKAAKKIFIDEYDDNLFHRALLTYVDYGTDLKSINQEENGRTVSYGITTYFRKTSIHGAPDWRDALIVVNWDKEGSCKANNVYIALRKFIDEFINTSMKLKNFQKDKIAQYNCPLALLRYQLIKKGKMFEFTDNYLIKKEEGKDILLRSKTKTGEKGKNWDYADEYYDSSKGEEGQTP